MAKRDALVAIENAVHKLEQPPNSIHNIEKLKSVKSKLQRWGSHLDKFNSVSDLTEVREFAYDVEDVMDDAIMVDSAKKSAQKRWRKMSNALLFFSRVHEITQELVDEQIEKIDIRKDSITPSSKENDDDDGEDEDHITPSSKENDDDDDDNDLFYLSLSGFHSDDVILARQLIQIWVAEGFVSMEEEGRTQIDRLLNNGFITQFESGTCGILKSFVVAKDKLDGCRSAAHKHNFLHVKLISGTSQNNEADELKATRLAVHTESGSLLTGNNVIGRSLNDKIKLRSLQIRCHPSNSSSNRQLDYEFLLTPRKKEFGSLRVLDLGFLELEIVPATIGNLAHLRYLRLRAPEAIKIAASICDLQNLQTIDLKETTHVKTMPVEIWKMKKNLRHLYLGGSTALPPPRMVNHYDAFVDLRTLCGVRPNKELKRLMVRAKFPNVNRLRLHLADKKDSAEEFLNSLDHLHHLRSLTLRGTINRLPSDWNAFPSSLIKMTLSKTRTKANNCVETLQNLPNLRYLKLMEDSLVGGDMECAAGGFPALKVVIMMKLKELKYMRIDEGAMRLLIDLKVIECEKLERVDAFRPSMELKEALTKLQKDNPTMSVQVDSTKLLQ